MEKIIIYNWTKLDTLEAIDYVSAVIDEGRISEGGKAYCYHMSFDRTDGNPVHVETKRNKQSDTFTVFQK